MAALDELAAAGSSESGGTCGCGGTRPRPRRSACAPPRPVRRAAARRPTAPWPPRCSRGRRMPPSRVRRAAAAVPGRGNSEKERYAEALVPEGEHQG
ncbi:hypothetical protein ACP70R_004017 [Stipagrostis hirtigluma subsp. patula]